MQAHSVSSEMELTEAGRLRLAAWIEQEKLRKVGEVPPKMQPMGEAMAALANEERRLKAACRRKP
jgi:hypothetical protein